MQKGWKNPKKSKNVEKGLNILKRKLRKSKEKIKLQDIAEEAGYTPNSARQGTMQRTKQWQEGTKDILALMEEQRLENMRLMRKKQSKASFRDLNYSADILTKNMQLLSGKPTERTVTNIDLTKATDEEIDKALNERLEG